MNPDLSALSVDKLVKLGGLKERCSAPLRCVAHGLNLPCELCELEERQGAVCTACGQSFPGSPPDSTHRPCASVAQFHARGVIAFADEARRALEKTAPHREAPAVKPHRVANKSHTPKVEPSRRPVPEPIKIDKGDAELRAKEHDLAEKARGARLARQAILASLVAALVGLKLIHDLPLTTSVIEYLGTPGGYVQLYLGFGLLFWYVAARPLFGHLPAHRALRWWAPAVWALVALPWPGIAGLVAWLMFQQLFSLGWGLLFWLAAAPGIWMFAYYAMAYVAVGLTMRKPWPPLIGTAFMPEYPWVWMAFTVLLNLMIFYGGSHSAPGDTQASAVSQPPPSPAAHLATAPQITTPAIPRLPVSPPAAQTPAGNSPRSDPAVADDQRAYSSALDWDPPTSTIHHPSGSPAGGLPVGTPREEEDASGYTPATQITKITPDHPTHSHFDLPTKPPLEKNQEGLSSYPQGSAPGRPSGQGDESVSNPWIQPKLYALVSGVSDYDDNALDLKFAAKDAKDFGAALQRQAGGLYREVIVRTLENPTSEELLDGLDWLRQEVTSMDIAIVYLSGHGVNDPDGDYYYLTRDASPERLRRTAVPYFEIKSCLYALPGKVLVFVDTGHSESILGEQRGVANINGLINDLTSAENGLVVFASTTGKQYPLENDQWGNGAFAKALVEGLNGAADYTQDGKITLNKLDLYLSERVKSLTGNKQTPMIIKPQSIRDFQIAVVR